MLLLLDLLRGLLGLLLCLLLAHALLLQRLLDRLLHGLLVVALLLQFLDLLFGQARLLKLLLDVLLGLCLRLLLLLGHLLELVGHVLQLLLQSLLLGRGHALQAVGDALKFFLSGLEVAAAQGIDEAVGRAARAGVELAHLALGGLDLLLLGLLRPVEFLLHAGELRDRLLAEVRVRQVAFGQRRQLLEHIVRVGLVEFRLVRLDIFEQGIGLKDL
ncbi:MAG: hypothetical protein R3C45_19405 [Phycisphaerales bacterium]